MKVTAIRSPAWLLGFVLIWFFTLSLRQLLDYDVWFQLLAGQEAFRTMSVPSAEFYIYSALGEPAVFVGWLWGLLLYIMWLVGGYSLISLFCALIWALTFVVVAAAILKKGTFEPTGDTAYLPVVQITAVLIATSVAYQYLVERAIFRDEVTLFLAWSMAIYLSIGISKDSRRLRTFLIAVPLLSWALGWLHTTSVFMVLLLAGYMLQAATEDVRERGYSSLSAFVRTRFLPWMASICAAAFLPVLNPNGIEQALPLISGLLDTAQSAGTTAHVNLEYRRLADVPALWPTAILFAVASIYVMWRDQSQRLTNVLFLSIGLLLSLLHVRALAIWAIFLAVPLGVAVSSGLHTALSLIESKRRALLLGVLAFGCCLWTVGTLLNKESARWGVGYSPRAEDQNLLNEIRVNMPHGGRIFNWFPLGAYLRWHLGPDFFVAIDGHLTNRRSAAWQAYYAIEDVRDQSLSLIERWNIQAVYHPVITPPHGRVHWLAHDLTHNDDWRLVAGDQIGLLFVRTSAEQAEERTRDSLRIAYWRRLIYDITVNGTAFGIRGTQEYHANTLEHARLQISRIHTRLKQ